MSSDPFNLLTIDCTATMCPSCGTRLDAATQTEPGAHVPVEGDLSVCLNCSEWLTFRADQTVRRITRAEVEQRYGRRGVAALERIQSAADRTREEAP